MIYCKEINEYISFVEAHQDEVSNDVKLLIQNVVIPTLQRTDIIFDSKTYYDFIDYAQSYYYELFPYQKFLAAMIFMYDLNDQVVFRTHIWIMGRANGKDGLTAPIVNFLQTQYYGVKKYHIDIVANAEGQAKDTFMLIYETLTDKKYADLFDRNFFITKEVIINRYTSSRLRFNTSNAKTKDGKQSGLIVFNEYHAYETNEQVKVFTSGSGKVKHFRQIIISTQGEVRDGPLDEILDICQTVLKGDLKQLKYFPFICRLDNPEEVHIKKNWHKANPSLRYMPDLATEIETQYEEMLLRPSLRFDFMTKRMNVPERNEAEAVTSWDNILKTSYTDTIHKVERSTPKLDGMMCIGGIDYADIRDFASAGFLFKINDEYIFRQKTWICKQSPFFNDIKFPFSAEGQKGFNDFEVLDLPSIPPEIVVGWIADQSKKYNMIRLIMDDYRYKFLEKAFMDLGFDIKTKENPSGIIRTIRNTTKSYYYNIATPIIEVAFLEQKINFGDSAMMRWATNNTKTVTNGRGDRVFEKIEPKLRKNDPFMCFVHCISHESELEDNVIYV